VSGELRESAVVRLTCPQRRNIHDGGCKTLRLCYRATDEMVGALCAGLPALTEMELTSRSLTDEGLGVVAELTSLAHLDLPREQRPVTARTATHGDVELTMVLRARWWCRAALTQRLLTTHRKWRDRGWQP
jgi:hypothetical protein